MPSRLALFERPAGPSGLEYRPDFVTPDIEQELIARMCDLTLTPFQFGPYEGKRRVASFGWRYDFSTQKLERGDPFPDWMLPVAHAVEVANRLPEGAVEHILFTRYDAGAGIGWHRDKKQFDRVFGLSLGSPCPFRFRRRTATGWERFTLAAEPRSLYTMTDEARSVWEHSIPPVAAPRWSITFRTMARRHAPR